MSTGAFKTEVNYFLLVYNIECNTILICKQKLLLCCCPLPFFKSPVIYPLYLPYNPESSSLWGETLCRTLYMPILCYVSHVCGNLDPWKDLFPGGWLRFSLRSDGARECVLDLSNLVLINPDLTGNGLITLTFNPDDPPSVRQNLRQPLSKPVLLTAPESILGYFSSHLSRKLPENCFQGKK